MTVCTVIRSVPVHHTLKLYKFIMCRNEWYTLIIVLFEFQHYKQKLKMWQTAVHLCVMTCTTSHIMLLDGLAVHRTTESFTTARYFKTLTNFSHISSTYLVIQHMNAALFLLACTRNNRYHPSLMNKKCSTQLYQSHVLNLNMQLVFGNEDSRGIIV